MRRRAARGSRPSAFALAVTAAALSVGCATLGSGGLQPVTFAEAPERQSTLRLLPPSARHPSAGVALRLWTRVENPNPFGLTLTDLTGTVFLEGREGPDVEFPLGLPLAAGQDTVIPLDVQIGFAQVPDLAGAVRAALRRGAVDYRLEGAFGVEAGASGTPRFGPTTLLEGELDVSR